MQSKWMGMVLAGASLFLGCQNWPQPASRPSTRAAEPGRRASVTSQSTGIDPRPAERSFVQLDVHIVNVPAGSVSKSEEFWKRLDEHCIDPGTHDVMDRNGVRVGVGSIDDWNYFNDILEGHPGSNQVRRFVSMEGRGLEIPVKSGLVTQTIWYFDRNNALMGRTFDHCDNLFTISFASVLRHPQNAWVGLCPMVRGERKHLELKVSRGPGDTNQKEITMVTSEQLFDVGLETELGPGKFLIVAPSPELVSGGIGDSFLTTEGTGSRWEQILVILPHILTGRPINQDAAWRGSK